MLSDRQGRVHADAKRCHGIGGPKFGIGRLRENFAVLSWKTLKVWLVPLPMHFFSSLQLRPASHWLTPIWHRSKLGLRPPLYCNSEWGPLPHVTCHTKTVTHAQTSVARVTQSRTSYRLGPYLPGLQSLLTVLLLEPKVILYHNMLLVILSWLSSFRIPMLKCNVQDMTLRDTWVHRPAIYVRIDAHTKYNQ